MGVPVRGQRGTLLHRDTPGLASKCWLTGVTCQPSGLREIRCKSMIFLGVEPGGFSKSGLFIERVVQQFVIWSIAGNMRGLSVCSLILLICP